MDKKDIPLAAELRPGAIYHVRVKGKQYSRKPTAVIAQWLKENISECKFIVTSDNIDIGSCAGYRFAI